MRQVNVHGANDVRLDSADDPVPGSRDVVVQVAACGICGTDLTFIRQGGASADAAGPMPLGHEAAGIVVSVGSAVTGIAVGQRVIVNPMGTSDVIGNGGAEGAFTERLLVRDAAMGRSLLPVPDGLSYAIAALAEPLGVAMHGVNRSAARPGEKIVVFGCGPIGLGAILWLADRGVEDVVAVDLHDERLDRARSFGARATINIGRDNLRERLGVLHGREDVHGREGVGTHAYIDAAGAPSILPDVVAMARKHARLVVIAGYRSPVSLDFGAMLTSEMSITTAMGYPDELPVVVRALPRLQHRLQSLISHRFPFDDVIAAFDTAGSANAAKVMIDFEGAIA